MSRGMLNQQVIDHSRKFLGRNLTIDELRLFPYIDYCCKNPGGFKREKINADERAMIQAYKKDGHIDIARTELDTYTILISKPFYDFMQQVLFASYVEPLEGGAAK